MTTEFQPMPEQPPSGWHIREGADGWYLYTPTMHNKGMLTAPVTIGEGRAVREEWRPDFAEAEIEYRDGMRRRFLLEPWFEQNAHWSIRQNLVDWQPASTMPDWAVRRYHRCVSCVPVQAIDAPIDADGAPLTGDMGRWGWLITREDE